MPGPIPRPANMRDVLYNYNWRVGYQCIPIAAVIFIGGMVWVNYKRNRYDRYFEKMRDPAYVEFVREKTALTPEKYVALISRLKGEMAEVRAKYGRE